MKPTILLFGSTGMLGNYVKSVLDTSYNIINIYRNIFNISTDSWDKLRNIVLEYNPHIIINCAGIIPQNNSQDNYNDYIRINTLFPHIVSFLSKEFDIKFIHITTDCVFDGKKGNYNELDTHTEQSLYGKTKSLGEPENAIVIRTSIIGEETNNKNSLLEWVKKNINGNIVGYDNHYWNGVTCLTLARFILFILDKNIIWNGVRHVYSPEIVSKYDLCKFINDIYKLNITITKTSKNNIIVDKSLSSIYSLDYNIEPIYQQILDQKDYL